MVFPTQNRLSNTYICSKCMQNLSMYLLKIHANSLLPCKIRSTAFQDQGQGIFGALTAPIRPGCWLTGPLPLTHASERLSQGSCPKLWSLGFFFFFLIIHFIYLFFFLLVMLSLCCCLLAFPGCGELKLLSSYSPRASHWRGFSCCRALALGCTGFSGCSIWAQ